MARRRANYSTDSRHYYDWLDKASEDIACARLLLEDDECWSGAAFHCQQTIEKALKAYILLKSDTLVDGHNLTWLCKRAMKYDRSFESWLQQCASLNHCYIETRYPADIPTEYDLESITGTYRMARDMHLFICGEVDRILEQNNAHPMQRLEEHR